MKRFFLIALCITSSSVMAQDKDETLPYYEVPDYSEKYTAGTVAARMVDALGFRFYWATEGLTEKDLAYKPNEEGRTTKETIDHIYDLTKIIVNSTLKKANGRSDDADMSFEDKRKQTLMNLKTAADILRKSDDISQYKIIFGERQVPFWNQINGPISDALWHCGQIVVFRRNSGNPMSSKVNHFTGKVRS